MQERTIFLEALDLDRVQQQTYLNQACGEDAELRQRVESLLAAHQQSEHLFGETTDHFDGMVTSDVFDRVGDTIGNYKLLELLGEGGFGTVYMAEQQMPVQRKVALKIIKPGMDSRQVVARFETERQALALMDHANIARVLDAGADRTGRPYFVMELVKGLPITDFCDRKKLNLRDRLELFIKVCNAVQHAHQKGIIHRDLKPSNVMVTFHDNLPVPKIIDFGIAKAIGQKLTENTLFTRYDQLVGTPQYMSPEQADMSGLDVDTRADVYALGVLLYELLTGTTPVDKDRLRSSSYSEVIHIIQNEVPPKPSTRIRSLSGDLDSVCRQRSAEPGKLSKLLRGDLDWIVMMAVAKDRNYRYESASTLAHDVQRHLNREPVLAGPPSALYQIRSFTRRHRAVMTAVASVFVALLIGLATTLAMFFGATEARDDAKLVNYASDMLVAGNEWNSNVGTASNVRHLLRRHFPSDGGDDLRDFAWRYQWTLLEEGTFAHADTPLRDICILTDGRLVTLDEDHFVRYWDKETGEPLQARKVHRDLPIRELCLSPHGLDIAIVTAKRPGITVEDAATGAIKWQHDFDEDVYDVLFASDSHHVTVLFCSGEALVWDVHSGELTGRVKFQDYGNGSDNQRAGLASLSVGGEKIVLAYHPEHNIMSQYDVATGRQVQFSDGTTSMPSVCYSPHGQIVASGESTGKILLWDTKSQQSLGRITGHSSLSRLTFSPDGKILASGTRHGKIELHNVEDQTQIRRFRHASAITALGFDATGTELVSADAEGIIKRWQLTIPPSLHPSSNEEHTKELVAFSPDGTWLAVVGDHPDKTDASQDFVELWNVSANQMVHRIEIPYVRSITFSPDGAQLAVGQRATTVGIWDTATGEQKMEFKGKPPAWPNPISDNDRTGRTSVGSLAYSPYGRYIVAGFGSRRWSQADYPQAFQVWDLDAGDTQVFPAHQNDIFVVYTRDGTKLATCSKDGTIHIWNTKTWKPRTISEFGDQYENAVFNRSGDELYVSDRRGRIHAMDVDSGRRQGPMVGHTGSIYDLAITSDGRTLASCGGDRTVRLWNTATGRQTRLFADFPRRVFSIDFSADDNHLVVASRDGTVRIFSADSLAKIDATRDK